MTTAVAGSNQGGSGAVTINFATRSGTNRFAGSGYEYYRNPALNTNYWFNERNGLPKNDVKLNQCGARVGGPIVLPGLYDGRGTAFYFFHYEQLRFPNSFTRTRTSITRRCSTAGSATRSATRSGRSTCCSSRRANGQISANDPTVMNLLNKIQAPRRRPAWSSATTNPLINSYVWQSPGKLFEHQPTIKLDYNLTTRHRLSGSAQVDLGRARSRLPERRRRAVPGRAELPAVHLDASALLDDAALDADVEPGQRAPRRHHGARRIVELRQSRRATARRRSRTSAAGRSVIPIRHATGGRPTARAGAARRRSASRTA